jgi:hypothetical protein
MTLYIILFILGLLTGYVIRPMFTRHKHDYELVLHKKLADIGVTSISYKQTSQEEFTGYKVNFDLVYVSYKKCKTCNHTVLSISNGSNREFCPDWDFIRDKVELTLKQEKEKEDQALFATMSKRIAEKDLTSPEVPYNPAHAKQTTPQ